MQELYNQIHISKTLFEKVQSLFEKVSPKVSQKCLNHLCPNRRALPPRSWRKPPQQREARGTLGGVSPKPLRRIGIGKPLVALPLVFVFGGRQTRCAQKAP